MHFDLGMLVKVLRKVEQNEPTFLDVLWVVDIDSHKELKLAGGLQEFDCAPLAELQIVHRNVRAHLNRLWFTIAFDFSSELFEHSFYKLNLIVHDLDNRRVSLAIPQNDVLAKRGSQVIALAESHCTNIYIVFIIDLNHLVWTVIDFFI